MKRASEFEDSPIKERRTEAGLTDVLPYIFNGYDSPSSLHRARVWSWFKHMALVCKEFFFLVQRLRFKFTQELDLKTAACISHMDMFQSLVLPTVQTLTVKLNRVSMREWVALQFLLLGPPLRFPQLDTVRFVIDDSTRRPTQCGCPPLVVGAGALVALRGRCSELEQPVFRLLPCARLDLSEWSNFSPTMFCGSRTIEEVRVTLEQLVVAKGFFAELERFVVNDE
jgi:hypothetical protein